MTNKAWKSRGLTALAEISGSPFPATGAIRAIATTFCSGSDGRTGR